MEGRLQILKLIEEGEISVEEGARRLEALKGFPEETEAAAAPPAPEAPARPVWVRWLWQVVFWPAVLVLALGGLAVTAVYAWEAAHGWLVVGGLLLALGVLGILVGWWMQRARWLYVHVRQPDGPNILIAMPLPLRLVGWLLRIARPFVPQLRETGVDELLLALHEELKDGRPFTVEVNEGQDGEQVRVYFG